MHQSTSIPLCLLFALLLAACSEPAPAATPPPATLAVVGAPTSGPTATTLPTLTTRALPTFQPTLPPATPLPVFEPAQAGQLLVELINKRRAENGCETPLAIDTELTEAAQRHTDDMAANNFFDHTGSDGSSFSQRITDAGYSWSGAAENVGAGYATPEEVIQAWMESQSHRENLLECNYRDIGIGYAQRPGTQYISYWTALFASPG